MLCLKFIFIVTCLKQELVIPISFLETLFGMISNYPFDKPHSITISKDSIAECYFVLIYRGESCYVSKV